MTTIEPMADFKELQEQLKNIKEQMQETASKAFKQGCQSIFDEHPQLTSFTWMQYTPYWNDGDVCEFSVHKDYPYATWANEEDVEYDSAWGDELWTRYEVRKGEVEPTYKETVAMAVTGLLEAIDDDTLKAIFGDHVVIRVTRQGMDIIEYDHE